MISLSISLISLALVYLIVGMYKPQWALLGMKNPSRLLVVVITAFSLMIAMTLYGEGFKQKQQAQTMQSSEPKVKSQGITPTTSLMTITAPSTIIMSPVLPEIPAAPVTATATK